MFIFENKDATQEIEFQNSNFSKADSLFKLSKDLDALRFRAPEKFNEIINEQAKKYNVGVAQIDSIFKSKSPHGIIGNNLMVDHLHPNVEGYMLIGKAFYETMKKLNYLPKKENPQILFEKQDSITRENFVFTKLDSIIGNNVVTLLKNDWPFTNSKSPLSNMELLNPKDFLDSISLKYIENKISYSDAYLEAATINLRLDNIIDYLDYMNILIYKYPGLKDIKTAIKYFYEQRKVNPQDYTSKRLGIISIYNNDFTSAIKYLNESFKSNPKDEEVLYNLAFANTKLNNIDSANEYIRKCLELNPKNSKCLLFKKKLLETN